MSKDITKMLIESILDEKVQNFVITQLGVLNDKVRGLFEVNIYSLDLDMQDNYNVNINYMLTLLPNCYFVCTYRGYNRVNPNWNLDLNNSKFMFINMNNFHIQGEDTNLLDAILTRLAQSTKRLVPDTEMSGYNILSKISIDRDRLLNSLIFDNGR